MPISSARFDLERAVHLAHVAAAAYDDDPRVIVDKIKASDLKRFSADGVAGFVALAGKELTVSFRGTDPRQFMNWLTNIDYAQVQTPAGRVHRGFMRALDAPWRQLTWHVANLLPSRGKIWVTGHSLGGALASLAALRLARDYPVAGVYTFGAPRVGCPDFANEYGLVLHRVESSADLVCCLPLLEEYLSGAEPLLSGLERMLPNVVLPRDVVYSHAGYLTLVDVAGEPCSATQKGEDRNRALARLRQIASRLLAGGSADLLRHHRMDSYLSALQKPRVPTKELVPTTCQSFEPSRREELHMLLLDRVREYCSRWIENLSSAAATLHEDSTVSRLQTLLQEALGDPVLRVCVCGEWGVGKSSLINALVGMPDLLPVSVLPTTSYVTLVQQGPRLAVTIVRNDGQRDITLEQMKALFQSVESDPTIRHLRVAVPVQLTTDGLALVDTPGLEDLSQTRARVTLEYLPNADVVVIVLASVPGLKASELRFIREHLTAREQRGLLAVVNQADTLNSAAEVAAKLASVQASLAEVLPGVPVLATRTILALDALRDGKKVPVASGISALSAAIGQLAARERGRLLAARFSRGARPILDSLWTRLSVEEGALGTSLQKAQQQQTTFHQQRDQIGRQCQLTLDQVEAQLFKGIRPWLEGLPQRVRQLAQRLSGDIAAITTMDGLRQYIVHEELSQEVARWQLRLGKEAVELLQAVLGRVVTDILRPGLEGITADAMQGPVTLPAIKSVFVRVPDLVFQAVEFLVREVLPRLDGHPALKVLLFLGPVLLEYVKSRIQEELRAAIAEQLRELPTLITQSYEDAFGELCGKVLAAVQDTLNQQLAAVESGLQEARNCLEQRGQVAVQRRQELHDARGQLEELRRRLDSLPSEVGLSEDSIGYKEALP